MKILNSICLPLIIFSILVLPFINSVPHRDGNYDFLQAVDFYQGGFNQYFLNWGDSHPPLKIFLNYLSFSLLGVNQFSYNLIGFYFGLLGIVGINLLGSSLFNKQVGKISAFLLSISPLYLASSLFGQRDFLVSVLIVISFYFYLKRQPLLYGIFASLSFLAKETGLVLAITILIIELSIIVFPFRRNFLKRINIIQLPLLLPFLVYTLWTFFLRFSGKEIWNGFNFSSVSQNGSISTIIHNVLTLNFINKYAFQQWEHLFLLNFNWIYWLMIILGLIMLIKIKNTNTFLFNTDKRKVLSSIILFFLFYSITVLSFQTYTIPRYILPLISILIIFTAWAIFIVSKRSLVYRYSIFLLILIANFFALFFSIDPISQKLWGNTVIFNEKLYGLDRSLAGNDGVTYNMQYLFIVNKRSLYLNQLTDSSMIDEHSCRETFGDPKNDFKTAYLLKLHVPLNCRKIYLSAPW